MASPVSARLGVPRAYLGAPRMRAYLSALDVESQGPIGRRA